jgi:5-methylcytosine-specific restriction endonuclease McrA
MDKRGQHRALLEEIAAGSTRFVFYSRKLSDDQPRNCQFCGDLFLPGKQPGLETPFGPAHWRRTLCSDECQGLRLEMRIRKRRADAIKAGSTSGMKVDLSAIRERDAYKCYLCGGQTIKGYKGPDRRLRAETDHVRPLSSGGEHHSGNLRCCCARCNSEKGTKTLVEAVRISSCGDINFDDLSLVGTPPTLPALRQPQELMDYLGKRSIGIFSADLDSFDFKMRKPEQAKTPAAGPLGSPALDRAQRRHRARRPRGRSSPTTVAIQYGWLQYSTGRVLPCLTVMSCGEIGAAPTEGFGQIGESCWPMRIMP